MGKRIKKLVLKLRDLIHKNNYKVDGQNFTVPEDTLFGARWALYKGKYELPERRLVQKWLAVDTPVVELGASFGIVSNSINRMVNPEIPIVLVEANPALMSYCRQNSAIEKRSGGKLLNCAVGYEGEEISFLLLPGYHSSHVADKNDKQAAENSIRIPAKTLSELLEEYLPDERFSLVCDIEGGELDIFRKDKASIEKCDCAIVEIHPKRFEEMGSSEDEFIEYAKDCGMKVVDQQKNVLVLKR